ncbi:MAG: xylulokinase [Vibrio sp.]
MYIGIDLGTSSIKSILMNESGQIIASESVSLHISRPQALWSEQDPQEWWQATCQSMQTLSEKNDLSSVKAIGLSGQMHGATLLDSKHEIIRPAILWNDGRSFAECLEIESLVPESRNITGNIMMPGFTAPKIKWVQKYEPENFAKIDKVLLPKDYVRFLLSGVFASDMSDAAGTMWMDVAARDWSEEMLAATGLTRNNMPALFEGSDVTGYLHEALATQWGMQNVAIVGGAGDNAAGAIGVGVTQPKQAMLSLGTSGVYFAVSDGMLVNTESALHSFCHALPKTWHAMSVILSAASCLDWVAKLTNVADVPTLLNLIEKESNPDSQVIFLPYLSGERTPHNDPNAKGVFWGMTHETSAADLGLAVLEGVGFALADGMEAVHSTGLIPDQVSLIGGGARSAYWRQMLSDISNLNLVFREGGDVGPAYGAARLAQLGVNPDAKLEQVCPEPQIISEHTPDANKHAVYKAKHQSYKELYSRLKGFQ